MSNNKSRWLVWPGLLCVGPLTIAYVYLAHAQGWSTIDKTPNEVAALILLGIAGAVFALRSVLQRNPLYLLMAAFAVIAWLREWHADWIHHGVYYLLAGLMIWAWLWRDKIRPYALQGYFMPWLKSTVAIYVLGVLLARRAFRDFLPNEEAVNTPLEETMENVAHGMLLIMSLLGSWRRPPATTVTTGSKPTTDGN